MKLTKKIKQLVLKCDLFKTTQYWRYKGQPEYRTFTGGFCSIVIFIVFATFFYNAVLSTINKNKMIWGYNLVQNNTGQFNISVTTKQAAKFMFAVGINSLNMNQGQRFFDLKLEQYEQKYGVITRQEYPLSPCNRSVWEGANSNIMQIYDRYNFSQFLCPPEDISFSIAGSKSSYNVKYVKISALKCNQSLSSRPCANDSVISTFLANNQNFLLNYYYVNGLVNPSNAQEVTFYLQDRNQVPFNLNYGGFINLYMSRYSISTDQSIWPFEEIRYNQGGIVNLLGQYRAATVFKGQYASIYLKKAHVTIEIDRSYTKMDSTLSYIGGLFGFFIISFIFMQVYTQYSYEIQMGDKLYYYNQNIPFDSNKFHFLSFIFYLIYSFFNYFGCSPDFQLMKKFDSCRNEIQKQFDITFLMKRIIFFERSLKILFEDHQFKGLHMHDKMTIKEAQQLRSYYRLRDKIKSKLEDNSENQFTFDKQSDLENSRSHQNNFTENIISNAPQTKESHNFGSDQKPQLKNYSYTRKVHPVNQPSKADMNNSELQIQQRAIQTKRIENNNHELIPQTKTIELSSKMKILRKQSESGNVLSKKILEGLDGALLKNILLKIQQKAEKQENEIMIRENQNDFQIRISKKGFRKEEKKLQQKFEQLMNNIDEEKLDQQVSKVQIDSAYHQHGFNERDSATSKSEKRKKTLGKLEGEDFQFSI